MGFLSSLQCALCACAVCLSPAGALAAPSAAEHQLAAPSAAEHQLAAQSAAAHQLAAPSAAEHQLTAQSAAEKPLTAPWRLHGYVEALYAWNFNNPSNKITNYRGFDNRHNAFTLSNLAFGASWDAYGVIGQITLQVGHTPSTYYLAEPRSHGADGANASNAEMWRFIQQGYAGYRWKIAGRELTISAGIFLSPIGPESLAVKESWNWSRSNLFFGLPFYHTGAKIAYEINREFSLVVHGYNGYNSVIDNNAEKTFGAQLLFARGAMNASFLYLGGVERPEGAPEGRAFRHLFDTYARWEPAGRLALIANLNAGFERNRFGLSGWFAAAGSARLKLAEQWHLAGRADVFVEHVAQNALGRAAAMFWPAPWVSSATMTLDYAPHKQISLRLEYRHDHAKEAMYFAGQVRGEGSAERPYVATKASQDTLLIGATTWF